MEGEEHFSAHGKLKCTCKQKI